MSRLFDLIRADIRANWRNWKGVAVLIPYRLAHAVLLLPPVIRPLGYVYLLLYKLVFEYVVGIEIHWRAKLGPGVIIYHGYGLVINCDTVIGAGVVLRHGTTFGTARVDSRAAPVIGDHVHIGASAIILGGITIGDHARIGAGAVVLKDVPPYAVAVGNPARVILREQGGEAVKSKYGSSTFNEARDQ